MKKLELKAKKHPQLQMSQDKKLLLLHMLKQMEQSRKKQMESNMKGKMRMMMKTMIMEMRKKRGILQRRKRRKEVSGFSTYY